MRIIRKIDELRAYVNAARSRGGSIGFVPTMGAFHAGHRSLMDAARRECETVILSIFVNPMQFTDFGDYDRYPRDEERDFEIAALAGVDVLFAPAVEEIYPPMFATAVKMDGPLVGTLARIGLSKNGQLDGMCTIITKLFNIVQPDISFFGEKDIPHWVAVERMVRDLDLPCAVKVLPTVREADGLAMSSRNVHLGESRPQAAALYRGLVAAAEALQRGESSRDALRRQAFAAMDTEIRSGAVSIDYLEVLDRSTLEPVTTVDKPVLLCVGARVGSVTLLDILRAEVPTITQRMPSQRSMSQALPKPVHVAEPAAKP